MRTVPPVLVVDDTDDMRRLIATVLRDLDVEVIEAESAEAALRWVRAVSFSVVVTDVEMPGLDGCELVRKLRADPATHRLPVVALSGGDHRGRALAAGADAFLAKPFLGRELADVVRRCLPDIESPPDGAGPSS